ncbi:Gfo/Idh/MocA family oxidoreductase [Arsenicicoccus piscis]|nr:Gfo/Idh/MocA family oxidoreductase [Arsenicicoccus piscis]
MGRLHTRSYKSLAERYPDLAADLRLVAAADPVDSAREFATTAAGFERAYADYRDLLADPDVDIVSICSPNFLHREIALAAVEAGKPFWIEKPMGVGAHESREIAEAAERAGLVTGVGFNYRHAPAVAHLRQLARSGALGRVTNVRVWLIADYASSPQGPLTWRYDRARAGAGVVGDLMSHGVDLAQYVVGRISEVTALTSTFIADRPYPLGQGVGHAAVAVSDERGPVENEDYVSVLARFDSGVVGTLESSRVSVGPRSEYVIEVYGTLGSARWNFEDLSRLEVCLGDGGLNHGYTTVLAGPGHGEFSRFQPGPGIPMSFDDLKAVEAKLFVESVLTGEQLAPSAADGWCAAEIDEAIVASAEDGRWHTVEPVAGRTTFDA